MNRNLEIIRNDIQDIRRNIDGGHNVDLADIYDRIPNEVCVGHIENTLDKILDTMESSKDYSGLGSLEAKIDNLAEQIAQHLAKDRVL